MLSEAQRSYLGLVAEGLTSKEIAQRLGGSHHTVNVEIGIAMRLLGAKSRKEAVDILLSLEDSGSYERSYEPDRVAHRRKNDTRGASEGKVDEGFPIHWPIPTGRRPFNDMLLWQRAGWIIGLAAGIALVVGGLVSGIAAMIAALDRLL